MANEYTQGDLKFIPPPPGATSLVPLSTKDYLPKEGKMTLLSTKGAQPHYVEGDNFRVRVGKKQGGRHLIAELSIADPVSIRYGKESLNLQSGVYYIITSDPRTPPIVQ